MTTSQTRESRSVRLSQDEWDAAEAISLLTLGGGAGHGLRTALDMAVRALRDSDQGGELDIMIQRVKRQRAERDR